MKANLDMCVVSESHHYTLDSLASKQLKSSFCAQIND
jgi:hypothetical protein